MSDSDTPAEQCKPVNKRPHRSRARVTYPKEQEPYLEGLNPRLLRFALTLQDRPIKIVHRPGSENCNADGFSRQSWNVKSGLDSVLSARPRGSSLGGGDVGLEKIEKARERKKEEK